MRWRALGHSYVGSSIYVAAISNAVGDSDARKASPAACASTDEACLRSAKHRIRPGSAPLSVSRHLGRRGRPGDQLDQPEDHEQEDDQQDDD